MTSRQAAELSGTTTEIIREAIQSKVLRGIKKCNRWDVRPRDAYRFGQVNWKKIERLCDEYVKLYWEGLSVSQLQGRVKEDFCKNRIVWHASGFAEQAIYRDIMRNPQGQSRT